MKKSILIEILSTFSRKEIREFSEYVSSPFFNKNQSIIKLSNYLRIRHPAFEKSVVEKKRYLLRFFRALNIMTVSCGRLYPDFQP